MLFGTKKVGKTSKKFKGISCLNCPNNKNKSIREDFLIVDSNDLDILFVLPSYNEKVIDLIDQYFKRYKIGFTYLTQCEIQELKPTSPEIQCCKKQVLDKLKDIEYKIIVGFNSHFLTWLYGVYYDNRMWRGKICPVSFNNKDTWQYTCLNYQEIENVKSFERKNYWKQLEVDFKKLQKFLKNYEESIVYKDSYEKGIELISGLETGDYQKLIDKLEYFKKSSYVAIDIENSPLKPWMKNEYYPDEVKLTSIAIGTFDEVISFPIEHPKCWNGKQDKILDLLEDFLLNSGIKIVHNLKHELQWFYWYFGKEVLFKTEWVDTQSLSYIVDHTTSKKEGMHSLGKLTLQYFGFNLKNQKEVDFKKLLDEPIKDLLTYGGRDSKWEYQLYFKLIKNLDKNQKWLFDFHNDDCKTFAISECEGYRCDKKRLYKFEKDLTKDLKKIEDEVYNLPNIKDKFDISSPKQLAEVFKKQYNLILPYDEKTKNYSTDEKVLKNLADKGNKLSILALKHRTASKQLSTYVKGIGNTLHPDDRFHSQFNSCFTKTGRKSSNNPNAQNFPKRKGKEIREIVIPEKDCVIISVDYGQLEARGYCMASNERNYIEKIKSGEDIHMFFAKRILELYPQACEIKNEKDLKNYRGKVKGDMTFSSFYGAGIYSRARNLGLPEEIMIQLDEEFWSYLPRIKEWQEKTIWFYEKNGYVETLTGRKLRGKDSKAILSMNDICNWPIQGTCSDIVGDSANRLSKLSYKTNNTAIHPTINIHDDLTFTQVPKNRIEETCQIIMKEMCRINFDFIKDVPLQVELSIGENWCDMEDKYVKDTRDFKYD